MKKTLISLLVGIIFAIVGIAFTFALAKPQMKKAEQSKTWPTTMGAVIKSEIVSEKDSEHGTMYRPEVVYVYSVDNREYTSNEITFGSSMVSTSRRKSVAKATYKYPVGKQVNVYYNPDEPYESVLETDVTFATKLLLWIGYLLIGVGALIFLIACGKVLLIVAFAIKK
jgi:Protein of unknown function (DUF3592)